VTSSERVWSLAGKRSGDQLDEPIDLDARVGKGANIFAFGISVKVDIN
jgi:hypothetical protein